MYSWLAINLCRLCVGWPNGEKFASTCVRIWARPKLTKVNANEWPNETEVENLRRIASPFGQSFTACALNTEKCASRVDECNSELKAAHKRERWGFFLLLLLLFHLFLIYIYKHAAFTLSTYIPPSFSRSFHGSCNFSVHLKENFSWKIFSSKFEPLHEMRDSFQLRD